MKNIILTPLLIISLSSTCIAEEGTDTAEETGRKNLTNLNILGAEIDLFMMTNGNSTASGGGIGFDLKKSWGHRTSDEIVIANNHGQSTTPTGKTKEYRDCLRENKGDNTKCEHLEIEINKQNEISKFNFSEFDLTLDVNGTIGTEAKKNPLDYSQARIGAGYRKFVSNDYTYHIGAFTSYELDQSNENSNFNYGASASIHLWQNVTSINNFINLSVDYARVNSVNDTLRNEILQGNDDKHYDRLKGKAFLQVEIPISGIKKLETYYIHYYEVDAPKEITDANLQSYGLFRAGLFFDQNFYIAFTDGKLPFSIDEEQSYQIGWSVVF
ncbi:hypothetical protein [Enterovibrio sp. 27052020O]|uniref:hypothetical protein n=1 Tax=Enterovibrio sp. 27052020O TaxID=3241166 RepID=UPI00388D40A2